MAKRIQTLLFALIVLWSSNLFALSGKQEVQAILEQPAAPEGVVFEIVDWDDNALSAAIPWVNRQIKVLRSRFPGLDIAVVSHGSEQFALLTDSQYVNNGIHNSVKKLITDHDVELELCLGHAHMQGFDATDFPDYVDISESGPSRISAYQALGYTLVGVDI